MRRILRLLPGPAVLFLALALLLPCPEATADLPQTLHMHVDSCNSAGTNAFGLERKGSGGFLTVTLDEDSTLFIYNDDTVDLTINGRDHVLNGGSSLLHKKAGDLAANETISLRATKTAGGARAEYGLDITVVKDSAVSGSSCPTINRFTSLQALIGALYPIIDNEVGKPFASIIITGSQGYVPVSEERYKTTKNDGGAARMKTELAGAGVSPATVANLPRGYRLVLYTTVSSTQIGDEDGENKDDAGGTTNVPDARSTEGSDGLADSLLDGKRSFEMELGGIYNLRRITAKTGDPESFCGLRLGLGASTLRPEITTENDQSILVEGHEPYFGSFSIRFESAYSSWGDDRTIRGFTDVGVRWIGPYGTDEAWRWNLTAGLMLPGISIGKNADFFLYLAFDYPLEGEFENHSIGVFSNINLKALFKK